MRSRHNENVQSQRLHLIPRSTLQPSNFFLNVCSDSISNWYYHSQNVFYPDSAGGAPHPLVDLEESPPLSISSPSSAESGSAPQHANSTSIRLPGAAAGEATAVLPACSRNRPSSEAYNLHPDRKHTQPGRRQVRAKPSRGPGGDWDAVYRIHEPPIDDCAAVPFTSRCQVDEH